MSVSEAGSRIFVSYAHHDDDLLDQAVKSFTEDLKRFYAAKTGGELSVFFDRESIGWGSDWRDKIDGELRSASIFMPIITMQYFNRQACRDELNAFYNGARRLDAGYLILPIVIMGADRINSEHPIPEVGLIEALQYQNLEDAFLAGRGTREWREEVSKVTSKLISVMERAEERMVSIGLAGAGSGSEGEGSEEFDLLAALEEIEGMGARLNREIEDVNSSLTGWTSALTREMSELGPGKSVTVMRAKTVQMAGRVDAPSRYFYESSVALSRSVEEADVLLRSLVSGLSEAGGQYSTELLENFLAGARSDSTALNEGSAAMAQMLDMLRAMETLSVPLRKAIKPSRIGITKLQDSARTIDSWNQIRIP